MAIGKRLDKKISSMIEGALALNLDIENVKATTLSGYRGLHAHQLFKFGSGKGRSPQSERKGSTIGEETNPDQPFKVG
jgi:hypothetical protein